MLIIVETKTPLLYINKSIIEFIKKSNYQVAKVDGVTIDYDKKGKEVFDVTKDQITSGSEEIRKWLYANVSDPLFLKVQRGDATLEEWKDMVARIKQDWP